MAEINVRGMQKREWERRRQENDARELERKRTEKKGKRFGAYMEPEIIDSLAYKSLSKSAQNILLGFKRRLHKTNRGDKLKPKWESTNDQELIYTYDLIQEEWSIFSRATVVAAIDQLIERGFIDVVSTGMGKYKSTSVYGLSQRYLKWHREAEKRKALGFKDAVRRKDPDHPGFKARGGNGFSQVRKLEPAYSSKN